MKFEQSQYYKIWDSNEGTRVVTTILNNPDLIKANHTFWRQKFTVDPALTPTNQEGEAVFISKMRQIQSGTMMDMRAPLGDSRPVDKAGVASYAGTIPDFIAQGYVEQAQERNYREKLFEQFGDANLIAQYATNELQRMVDSANQTLSNMSAQVLSTGKIIYNFGEGAQGGLLKAEIPAENFDTAGKAVWNAPECRLLDQMVEKEKKYRDLWGENFSLQWEITRDMFNEVFLKNAQVIEQYRYYNSLNGALLPERIVLDEDMVKPILARFEGLSPIVIVEEKQKDSQLGIVHGWKEGVAVLRPVGFAGLVRRTENLDEILYKKYGSTDIVRNFARALQGVAVVMNTTLNNGNLQEWHTDLMMSAVPTLDEFLYHVIIDTTEADA